MLNKIQRLKKRHARAMSVFHFISHRLEKIKAEIMKEINERHVTIENYKQEIEAEEAAIAELNQHHVQVSGHAEKIAGILQ